MIMIMIYSIGGGEDEENGWMDYDDDDSVRR